MPWIPRRSWSFWLDEDQVAPGPHPVKTWNNSSGCTTKQILESKLKQSVEFTIRETGSLYYADDTIFTFVHESCLFDQEVSSNRTCKPLSSLRSQTLRCSRSFPTPQLWQSLHGFRVSDGFCFGFFRRILAVFVFVGPVMPSFGTAEFGVVCDGLGRPWFFVLQWWEEIRHWRTGFFKQNSFSGLHIGKTLFVGLGSYGGFPTRKVTN